jgi:N-acetylglucosaminyldiphosphoundecaprenol N-acetyl-beta-D-mannosaminyltransferase
LIRKKTLRNAKTNRFATKSDFDASMSDRDDLSRNTYGVLGIPIDAVDIVTCTSTLEAAAHAAKPYLISTPNLNFLINSQSNKRFRESLLLSDLSTADGMPIVWLAKLIGVPVKDRVAGSDIFEALKRSTRMKVFFFGGAEGIAAEACRRLNDDESGMACVGALCPGFGTIEDMSTDKIIDTINSSSADLLVVALGAEKGQAWLTRNHHRIRIPLRVHLGATMNFQAGSLKRAPALMQKWGMEWLWRIKEEPKLWTRYCKDGIALLKLLITRVLPLVIITRWNRGSDQTLVLERAEDCKSVTFKINGSATARNIDIAITNFRAALAAEKDIAINCAGMERIDARFIGLLLMLNKALIAQQHRTRLEEVPPAIARILRLNGFGYLYQ